MDMQGKLNFDDVSQVVEKEFYPKDFFFNNGIVNLYQFLEENGIHKNQELFNSKLILDCTDTFYNELFSSYLKGNAIVRQTRNDRWYFSEQQKKFILDKKYEIVGASSGNDIKNSYEYKTPEELNLSTESIRELYIDFCEENNFIPDVKEKIKIDSKDEKTLDFIKNELNITAKKLQQKDKDKIINYLRQNSHYLNVPNGDNEVVVHASIDTIINNSINYFVKKDILEIDSKIHTFESKVQTSFDMVKKPKNYNLNKWEALIYWFGGRIKRFYNYSYFIYPNTSNLKNLYTFKKYLEIADITVENSSSNIDFYDKLSKDGIHNKNFYISKSAEEFEVKFFMYLFSLINHIEEQYENATVRRKIRAQELYETLKEISFVMYVEDGDMKKSLSEYTKGYKLIKFFELLHSQNLFAYVAEIMATISLSQGKNELNLNLMHFASHILEFKNVREILYLTSFNTLKNNSKGFGKNLFAFTKAYLNYIQQGEEMSILEESKIIGEGVGHFCAELNDKDLLFKLRNIKNYKQLVSYFKDLKFSALKNESKAKFSKEFNASLENLLQDIEQNWEIARDYIAIYAIDKFKSVHFAKTHENK